MFQKIFFGALKIYCQAALWFYFSRWQVRLLSPIPKGPAIFVSNHQNAFLDAILIICSSYRNPWSLTRAEVFKKPLARKILTLMQMIPAYRFRDGFSTLRKKDSMIDTCLQVLDKGECILIFGEGNHSYEWNLRPLQKGFARIAIAAEEKYNWKQDVQIVPLGVQYESHMNFRSRVLVTFGKPIPAREYMSGEKSAQENMDAIITAVEENLKPLILNIPTDRYHDALAYLNVHRTRKQDLTEQLTEDQRVVDEFYKNPKTGTGKINKPFNPFYFYYAINHIIPRAVLGWVLNNKVTDHQFTGSVKYALGMVLFPLFQVIQTAIVWGLSGSLTIAGIYLMSLLLSVISIRN